MDCIKMVVTMNRYGHPHQETLERLRRSGCQIRSTKDSAALGIRVKKNIMMVEFR